MANVFKFGNGCQLALNLDNVGAVDVSEVENRWCVRFFFTGGNGAYNLSTDNKEIADGLFETIVKAMEEKDLFKSIMSSVNTLEVKEVDLEAEIEKWQNSFKHRPTAMGYKETAKHFFELGLKAQKGEKA